MGRTIPTFNTFLQNEESSWRAYRRALRNREEKEAFEALFARARVYTAEATAAARPVPFDSVVMSILLSQELELRRLRQFIDENHSRENSALEEGRSDEE